jgi:predicted dehydrogenase
VAVGNENALRIRIYGTKGGLDWGQENPNYLRWSPIGKPTMMLTRGGFETSDDSRRVVRVPAGHPEGYLEGFGTLYSEIAQAIIAARTGDRPDAEVMFPTIDDGVKGLTFIEASFESSKKGGRWTKL